MKGTQPVFAPGKTRHAFELEADGGLLSVLRTDLEPSTLMLAGAAVQCLALCVLPVRLAIAPTLCILGVVLLDTILQTLAIIPNRRMKGVIRGRTAALLPSPAGTFSDRPADEPVVVFMLGARYNHPLGLFAPNVKELGEHFNRMYADALANSTKYGLLGAGHWNSAAQRTHNMTVFYFRSVEGLHEFAKTPLHVEAVRWWSKITKDANNAHIGIMHETFSVPAKNWEAVYMNFQPTGLAALSAGAKDEATGEEQWFRTVASIGGKSPLRTMYGRMGRTDGGDNEKYAADGFL